MKQRKNLILVMEAHLDDMLLGLASLSQAWDLLGQNFFFFLNEKIAKYKSHDKLKGKT